MAALMSSRASTLRAFPLEPGFRIWQICPAEGERRRAMCDQVLEPRLGFNKRRKVTDGNPPHRHCRLLGRLEKLMLADVDRTMSRLEYEFAEGFGAFPDRKIDGHFRIAGPVKAERAFAAFVLQPPHESRHAFGERIDAREISIKVRHARIVGAAAQTADIDLGDVHLRIPASRRPSRRSPSRSRLSRLAPCACCRQRPNPV